MLLQIQYLDDFEDKIRIFYKYGSPYCTHYFLSDESVISTLRIRINMYFLEILSSKCLHPRSVLFWKRKGIGVKFRIFTHFFFKFWKNFFLYTLWKSKNKNMFIISKIYTESISESKIEIFLISKIFSQERYKV